jgi:hypothetical protein
MALGRSRDTVAALEVGMEMEMFKNAALFSPHRHISPIPFVFQSR